LSETEDFGALWQALGKWVEGNNFSIDRSRPSYEIYQNNPEEHPQKLHIVGICMSVKEK
jgi:AraC family transcriptional regulator